MVYSCLLPSDCQNRNTHILSTRYFPDKPGFSIFYSPLTSPGSLMVQQALPILGEMWRNIKRRAELLSKHLESIHSQSGSRGQGGGGGGGEAWEKEGNKRARGRQWERNTPESATFFLLKLIKYGPGLLKTRGLPGYWVCPGLGRLCSLLHCTLHCPVKAPHMVLTHKQSGSLYGFTALVCKKTYTWNFCIAMENWLWHLWMCACVEAHFKIPTHEHGRYTHVSRSREICVI